MHTRPAAINALFAAIEELVPHVLSELRQVEGDDAAVAREWARRHRLDSKPVIKHAAGIRAERFRRGALISDITLSWGPLPFDAQTWWSKKLESGSFPDPTQTQASWLTWAKQAFREAQIAADGTTSNHRGRKQADLKANARLFVALQLDVEQTVSALAGDETRRRSTRRRAGTFASLLDLELRPLPPGGDNRRQPKK